jgi:hypothetical protein
MYTAIAHIVGALLVSLGLGVLVTLVSQWEIRRNIKLARQNASIALGVPVEDIQSERYSSEVIRYSATRYNGELLRNRISDLCGVVRTLWAWVGSILQIGILLGVILRSLTDPKFAVLAWWIIAVQIAFWLVSVLFSHACKIITGRYPGEAKQARKALAEFISQRAGDLAAAESTD